MATKLVSVVTGGSNSHQTSSAEINGIATDFISQGVVGAVSNTSGVAPATGAFAVNAIGTPNMSVRVTNGVAYVTATPTGGTSQTFRVTMDATEDVTIAANATGGTRYDWIYIKLDADKLVNPAVDASDVVTLTTSRSTSSSTDNGTPPTYGYCLAVVTVSNGASSITNSNITDSRKRTGANMLSDAVTLPTTTVVNAQNLSTSSILLGYAAVTSNQAITTTTDLTGLSVTVTVPSGGRSVKITGFTQFANASANWTEVDIKESTTVLGLGRTYHSSSGAALTVIAQAFVTPSAGSHTYKLTGLLSGGTSTLTATSTGPAFILVEMI